MSEIPERLRAAFADRYPIERELGSGGMATVYLARDAKHGRPVALKILHQEYARDIGPDRFVREIEIAASLTHPNILPLHDSGEADGFLYYVMPYVEGESLRDRLDREKELPVEDAVRIAGQIADALAYAHRQGIIHRDIKPENILLEDGQAVVADFGIARAVSAAGGEGLTATGLVVGTPQYMSPEQGSGEHDIDARSDLYALGCVLHEMLAGEPPFMGRTARSVIAKHMSETPPSVRAARPDVPDWLEGVVHTALAKSVGDRFSTGETFAEALATHTAPRRGPARVIGGDRRRLAAAVVAVALALAAGYFVAQGLDRGPEPGVETRTTAAALDPARLAVLYFEDQTEDGRLGPLCAAFTRKLIHELSAVGLDVISYNGIKPYRGADVGPDSLARALGVGTIVEASVAESGGQLRVLAQLIDAATARVLDSQEIERPRGETFALLDEVAREVSEFLRPRLGVEIRLKERLAETESQEAWNLVQRAELLRDDFMPLVRAGDTTSAAAMLERADSLLARAAVLDPDWTDPPVLRGWIAWELGGLRSEIAGKYAEEWIRRGLEHAERALRIQPGDPGALELRGTLRYGLWNSPESETPAALLDEAERDLRAALEADPTRARAWNRLSTLLHLARADFREAQAAAERAYAEDQFLEEAKDIIFRLTNLALELGDYKEAARWSEEGRRRFPDVVNFAAYELAFLTFADGPAPDVERAWHLVERIEELSPPHLASQHVPLAKVQVAAVLARAGLTDSAIAVIERTKADASEEVLAFIAYDEAHAWLLLGERAKALDALEYHLEREPTDKDYIAEDIWFAELRDDPRFRALVGAPE